MVTLASNNINAATTPASVTVAAGATTATFAVTSKAVATATAVTITGTYNGVPKTATLTVNPSGDLAALTLNPTAVVGRRNQHRYRHSRDGSSSRRSRGHPREQQHQRRYGARIGHRGRRRHDGQLRNHR